MIAIVASAAVFNDDIILWYHRLLDGHFYNFCERFSYKVQLTCMIVIVASAAVFNDDIIQAALC